MDRKSIFTKTAKGLNEASGKTSVLPRDLRNVLKEVDGKLSVGDLLQRLTKLNEPKLTEMLGRLEGDGFLKEFMPATARAAAPTLAPAPAPAPAAPAPAGDDGD